MKPWRLVLFAACSALFLCQAHAQASPAGGPSAPPGKSALLIGIGSYKHADSEINVPANAPRTGRYQPALIYPDLRGPKNDVAAMRALLTSEKFGFPDDDKHIHVVLDQDATREAVLRAMQQYLVIDPQPGDTVVLYISSHGSVRADPNGHGQLYDLDGTGRHPLYLENTIVPYDWYKGVDDIFSRDLRHIFNQAADRKIHVTAIFDSCHSGSLARGIESPALVARDFAYDPRPMPPDPFPAETAGIPPQSRSDNPVLVLSAAQKDQLAFDVQSGVPPHGLFTSALIETLEAVPAGRSADDAFRRLQIAMERAPGAAAQQPELDTSGTRRKEPLFGGAAGSGPATAAIVSVDAGTAVLDVGPAGDIGPGSEFAEINEVNGVRPVLRVTESIGLARSKARVVAPPGAVVQTKDILQLTKWVPAERPTLSFYPGASNLTLAEVQAAWTALRSAGLTLTADPSADSWTHHLLWDGSHWALLPHSSRTSVGESKLGKPVVLGARLTAAELKKAPPGSVIWFDAPLPKESLPGLLPNQTDGPPQAAVLTSDRNSAMYVVAGTATGAGIAYAWLKRSDRDAGVQTPQDMGAGCSPNSPYPLRTDWVSSTQPEAALTASAVQLAKLNGWLNLESSSLGVQTEFGYRLALRRVPGMEEVSDGDSTYLGSYEMNLMARDNVNTGSRWVYVIGIDCQGMIALLWPYDRPAAKFPTDEGRLERIVLPDGLLTVKDPLGTDTYLLLTTASPLANPSALASGGVVTRGANMADDPLEDLLDATSAGIRSASRPTPTNWSVQVLRTHSRPGLPPSAENGKQ